MAQSWKNGKNLFFGWKCKKSQSFNQCSQFFLLFSYSPINLWYFKRFLASLAFSFFLMILSDEMYELCQKIRIFKVKKWQRGNKDILVTYIAVFYMASAFQRYHWLWWRPQKTLFLVLETCASKVNLVTLSIHSK